MTDQLREDIANLREVVESQARLGHLMTIVPNDVLVRLLLAATPTPDTLDEIADDVRYAGGGGGTSDYWRGFNDGIDKPAARLRSEDQG